MFLCLESLQAVCAGVPGEVQCEEDAICDPAQAVSQWKQKGTTFTFIIYSTIPLC